MNESNHHHDFNQCPDNTVVQRRLYYAVACLLLYFEMSKVAVYQSNLTCKKVRGGRDLKGRKTWMMGQGEHICANQLLCRLIQRFRSELFQMDMSLQYTHSLSPSSCTGKDFSLLS